ncbi:hypothetical protein OROHE_001090 [Orobanche hederae]
MDVKVELSSYVWPICCTYDYKIVLDYGECYLLYNVSKRSLARIQGDMSSKRFFPYVENLLWH